MNSFSHPCCVLFENLLSHAGEKGFAILPRVQFGKKRFTLQGRPFEKDELSLILESTAELKRVVPVVSAILLPLKHCPGCGKLLDELIEQNSEAFDTAAKEAEPLFLS